MLWRYSFKLSFHVFIYHIEKKYNIQVKMHEKTKTVQKCMKFSGDYVQS